jgi:hypothetical protein
MDRTRLENLGRLLADRHAAPAEPQPQHSLLNYAESSRVGDWTMRSALVRFAQPEPLRASSLLELVRRLDTVLQHVARPLERHTVRCDRELGESFTADPIAPYPDTRTVDLARLERAVPDGFATILGSYAAVSELDQEEHGALPLLGLALQLDDLAATLTRWANDVAEGPPVAAVDEICAGVRSRMDDLGVPSETRPPGRGRP